MLLKIKITFIILFISLFVSRFLYAIDFEFEILSNDGDVRVIEIPGILTYRQFKVKSNWKDTFGDWGIIECTGTHTVHRKNGTILKNYCIGTNAENDKFWLIMDRDSDDFEAGIGEIKYVKGTGKFKKYVDTNCVYAVAHLSRGKGSFVKAKCNFSKNYSLSE